MILLQQFFYLFLVLSAVAVLAWSPSTHRMGGLVDYQSRSHYIPRSALFLAKQSDDNTELVKDETGKESTGASFGVSFIGGDPCGSKYNNDPFDTKEAAFKPGFPDDMKDRIAALAAKKLEEQKSG